MRTWFQQFIVIAVAFSFVVPLIAGCSDATSIEREDQCKGNHAPSIGELLLVVNDEVVSGEALVQPSDTLKVWIKYADSDCNLGGGDLWWSIDGGTFVRVRNLGPNLPCRGLDNNQGIVYTVDYTGLSAGLHQFRIGVTDRCDAASNILDGSFTMTGDGPDDDVTDDDVGDDDVTDDDITQFEDGLLENGDFEYGDLSWDENPDLIIRQKNSLPTYIQPLPSGEWAAIFDDSHETIRLMQDFKVPANTYSLVIGFEILIYVPVPGAGDDTMTVELLDFENQPIETLFTFTKADQFLGWRHRQIQVDVMDYINQYVKVSFTVTSTGVNKAYFFIDNVAALSD